MSILLSSKVIWTCQTHSRRSFSSHPSHCSYALATSANYLVNHGSFGYRDKYFMHSCLSTSGLGSHNMCISKLGGTNKVQHLRICASSSDDYRSSQNIAVNLYTHYRNFVDRGGTSRLKEFIRVGVNAYSLGCTDEGLRKELMSMKDSGTEIYLEKTYGGKTGLKCKICSEEVRECIFWLSIIFMTILCTPQPTVIRWSATPPVSDEIMDQWKGFCALIANAYYVKGMAWLPVKTLQLEQMVVMGRAEEPSIVSSRMRLVFSTLEVVSPQWPRV